MRGIICSAVFAGISACGPADSVSRGEVQADIRHHVPVSSTRSTEISGASATPFPIDLQRGIEAMREFEVNGHPCLARPVPRLIHTPEERRRQREIQSDSHWLNRHLRETYPERLNFSGLDARGPQSQWRHIVRLTGSEPVPALRLRDRAADIPVVVEYDAPWSLAEVSRRREAGNETARRLIPELQGEGYTEWPGYGAVTLDVYLPGSRPDAEALARCDALRRAYRLPVLITFLNGRVSEDMGQ